MVLPNKVSTGMTASKIAISFWPSSVLFRDTLKQILKLRESIPRIYMRDVKSFIYVPTHKER